MCYIQEENSKDFSFWKKKNIERKSVRELLVPTAAVGNALLVFFYDPVQRNAQDPSTNYYEAPVFHLKENRNFLYINIYLYTYVFYPFPLRECSQTFSDRKLLCTRGWFAR